jgi:hypothetical protein
MDHPLCYTIAPGALARPDQSSRSGLLLGEIRHLDGRLDEPEVSRQREAQFSLQAKWYAENQEQAIVRYLDVISS